MNTSQKKQRRKLDYQTTASHTQLFWSNCGRHWLTCQWDKTTSLLGRVKGVVRNTSALLVILDLTCCQRIKLNHQVLLSMFLQEFGLVFKLTCIPVDTVNKSKRTVNSPSPKIQRMTLIPCRLFKLSRLAARKGRDLRHNFPLPMVLHLHQLPF